jgi:hypothetical protein
LVNKETEYGLTDRGSIVGWGTDIFYLPPAFITAKIAAPWILKILPLGFQRPEGEVVTLFLSFRTEI